MNSLGVFVSCRSYSHAYIYDCGCIPDLSFQVLKAIHYGDSALFLEHPELLDSIVRVYFHSSSQKYNRMECWGPLKDAMEVKLRNVEMNNDLD